jgi:siroheme decarboxylase
MDEIDRLLINTLQKGFPICDAPYQRVAEQLGLTEPLVLARLQALLLDGTLTRFGPLYHAELLGGALSLAAMQVPDERFEAVAAMVNALPEIAHNYQRRHALNMWFVIATQTPEQVPQVIAQIEQQTGLTVYNMPKIKEYFVQLQLEA